MRWEVLYSEMVCLIRRVDNVRASEAKATPSF